MDYLSLDEYRAQMGLGEVSDPDVMTAEEYLRQMGQARPSAPPSPPASPERRKASDIEKEIEAAQREARAASLLEQIRLAGLPAPVREYPFHGKRRWLFDFAWPSRWIAFEIDGGMWLTTRTGRSKGHAHPIRFIRDIEKRNEANLMGWCMLHATPEQVDDGTAVSLLIRAFGEDGR